MEMILGELRMPFISFINKIPRLGGGAAANAECVYILSKLNN